jgi:hypothetical protein
MSMRNKILYDLFCKSKTGQMYSWYIELSKLAWIFSLGLLSSIVFALVLSWESAVLLLRFYFMNLW